MNFTVAENGAPRWGGTNLDDLCRLAYQHLEHAYIDERTKLIYACVPSQVTPKALFKQGFLYPSKELGYGVGLEDCAIFGGVALSMLVDWFEVTQDASLVKRARTIYEGLRNLVLVHGIPGFVARGLCVEDGKSICVLSSRDQVTHFVHGLWRYWRSSLSGAEEREEIGRLLTAVSMRMKTNCTPENDYDFLCADGSRDERKIQRMWNCNAHEMARLPMVYLATWTTTGEAQWRELYEGLVDEALASSLQLSEPSECQRLRGQMPEYTLLQMQSSLEVLWWEDEGRRDTIRQAMKAPAEMGVERARVLQGGKTRWLCGAAETLLAQLYVPDGEFAPEMTELLYRSLTSPALPAADACRIVHMTAAYWRWRRARLV